MLHTQPSHIIYNRALHRLSQSGFKVLTRPDYLLAPDKWMPSTTWKMLPVVLIAISVVRVLFARPSMDYLENQYNLATEPKEVRSKAIKQLLEVFGMDDPPLTRGHKQPPQYMLDLYNTVADVDGVTKDPHLLEGNTVRSFFDKRKTIHIC